MSTEDGSHGGRRGPGYLLVTSVGALGVVYGDIGTSPLYAFRESFLAADGLAVTRDSVLGILSLMFWSLVLVVSLKYLVFVFRADNHGEGGILALTALVTPRRNPASRLRWGLILIGIFGTALLYGDGMITPAISVLSAVEGIEIVTPTFDPYIVPIAAVILVLLFSIQHRGTATVGTIFGPVMVVWFSVLALLGVGRIVAKPDVLEALLPNHAARFFLEQPRLAFLALGAIFLVVTGSEALYADMGHFGKRPIRLGWFSLVLPALLVNYFGQGALIIGDPAAIDNPFYRLSPDWFRLPLVFLATLATVIASQALITGAYSLTMQAVQLGYLPRFRIDHTSHREYGQVYVAAINWILMVACVGLVVAFGSSSNLAAAYGVAVTTTMVITTILLFIVMRERWHWPLPLIVFLIGGFLTVDLAFFGANLVKIPAGGWFPLLVGAVVFILMTTWRRGRQLVAIRLRRGDLPIERFIASIVDHPQRRVPGTAVYLFPEPGATPPALLANLRHHEVLHETVVLVAVRTAQVPRVPQAQRDALHDLGEGFKQVVLTFGFMDEPNVPRALADIVSQTFGFSEEEAVFFLGKETVTSTERPGMARWRERLFSVMHRNATNAALFFGLPADRVSEVGLQIEI